MKGAATTVRDRLRHVFGADEPPARVAAAWALGIGVGLSPLLGLHTVIGLALAFALRLNKVDVLLGTMISNPWFLGAYFPASALLGSWMLGVEVPRIAIPELHQLFSLAAWQEHGAWLRPLVLAWAAGSTPIAALGATVAFFGVKAAVLHHRVRHPGASAPG